MGCGASQPKKDLKVHPQNEAHKERATPVHVVPPTSSSCFDCITAGVDRIAITRNMMPVVCLSRDAFPVVTYAERGDSFILGENPPRFPIVAGSMVGRGRVLCFSQLQFLFVLHFAEEGNARLIANALRWLGGAGAPQVISIGFASSDEEPILGALRVHGAETEFASAEDFDAKALPSFSTVLISSELDISNDRFFNALVKYVEEGGGLGIFFTMKQFTSMAMPINRLLLRFNLAFTLFILEEETEPDVVLSIPDSYARIRDVNFVPLLARFKAIVKQSVVDEQALDDVVAALHYYVMACDESRTEELEQLMNYSWDFLKRTGYSTPAGLCPNVTHSAIALLIFDLSMKLPPAKVPACPEHKTFPGEVTGTMASISTEMTVTLELETWRSTGLWLPAATVGVIECDTPRSDLLVQIGAHSESLFGKPGPWLRWPLVVTMRALEKTQTEVASAFGGLVYIVVNLLARECPPPVRLRFEGFVKHPIIDSTDPSAWEQSKMSTAPWGELIAGRVTFTLPSRELPKLNPRLIDQKFKQIIEEISRVVGREGPSSYRFIFDVEVVSADCPKYPMIFLLSEVNGVLNHFDEPCPELFKAVQLMANASITENFLDEATEGAVAAVVASVVFQKFFQGFEPTQLAGLTLSPLFQPLWEIQKQFPNIIRETLSIVLSRGQPPPNAEDAQIAFVVELCNVAKRDFTPLFEGSNLRLPVQVDPMFTRE
jgi:hypothetical protein